MLHFALGFGFLVMARRPGPEESHGTTTPTSSELRQVDIYKFAPSGALGGAALLP